MMILWVFSGRMHMRRCIETQVFTPKRTEWNATEHTFKSDNATVLFKVVADGVEWREPMLAMRPDMIIEDRLFVAPDGWHAFRSAYLLR